MRSTQGGGWVAGTALALLQASVALSAASIEESTVRAHMEFLASDALNGRGSGSRDEWITATYIGAQLRRMQLTPLNGERDFVETVDIGRNQLQSPPVLTLGASSFLHGEQVIFLRLQTASLQAQLQHYRPHTPIPVGAALLMPDSVSFDSNLDLTGAALVLWHESPDLRARWSELAQRPLNVGRPWIISLGKQRESPSKSPSHVLLSSAAYAQAAQLKEGAMVSFVGKAQQIVGHTWNAVGQLPGQDPRNKSVILLSAHLDHLGARETGDDKIFNGADDDASGSIAVLTLAEALAAGPALKRTVVFAWFGSEEIGSYGARYFVDKPIVPLTSITANLEFEMIGRPDTAVAPHTLWLTGWERTNLGPALAEHGAKLVTDPHPEEHFFTRSDNITLARRGVIAQTVSSYGLHADYHQPSDDIAHIDFGHMTEAIQSLLQPIRWLADSDFKPDWMPGGKPE